MLGTHEYQSNMYGSNVIWSPCCSDYEDNDLLGCNIVLCGRELQTVWKDLSTRLQGITYFSVF